jgi:hypothetical protein
LKNKKRAKCPLFCCIETDFEGRYIVTSGTLKQLKLIFDTFIDFTVKQLTIAYFNAKKKE